jgi:hypothetical protein
MRPGRDQGINKNGTVVASFPSMERSQSQSANEDGEESKELAELAKGNWTVNPFALAKQYSQGHEQIKQVK